MRSKFKWIFTLLLAFSMQFSFAQEKNVTGTITENGLPLPGVSIMIKGTTKGTQTDMNGKYSISASQGDALVFTYIGFVSQTITVGASSTINLVMQESAETLGEVIVEGYKTTTKAKSSNAVTTISASTIEGRPNASVIQTLQGQVAGLNISTGSGQPGANSTVVLRGVGSINGNIEPLYVIDGVPLNVDNFRSLNPNDIETISVLKDAGATAIYGNRGANGVIVITTKRGSFDASLEIKYASTYGLTELQENKYNVMNSQQLLETERLYGSGGLGVGRSDAEIAAYAKVNTNWKDYFFRTGVSQNHSLSLSSGSENLSSYTSFGYFGQEGILKTTDLTRFNFRNNVSGRSANKKFTYNTNVTLNYSKRNEASSVGTGGVNQNYVLGANNSLPYLSPDMYVDSDQLLVDYGADTIFGDGTGPGPLAGTLAVTPLMLIDKLKNATLTTEELKIVLSANMNYDITDKLSFGSSAGIDFTQNNSLQIDNPGSFNSLVFQQADEETGFQSEGFTRDAQISVTSNLKYDTTIGEKNSLAVGLFTEYNKGHYKAFNYTQNGLDPIFFSPGSSAGWISFNPDTPTFYNPGIGAVKITSGLFSYFATADYDYDRKYGFGATIRRDASFRFNDDNKWGTFWSVSGRWNIDRESFMDGSVFDVLKLRASYGTTGNQLISGQNQFNGANLYLNLSSAGQSYNNQNAYLFTQLGNPDLKWEKSTQANIGIDFELFTNKLVGGLDVYRKKTEDLYQFVPLSAITGQGGINANSGSMQNSGIELSLKYDIFKNVNEGGFEASVFINGSYNKNELLELPTENGLIWNGGLLANKEGDLINQYYLVKYAGVNPSNGNLMYYDLNGQITENPTDADRVFTGKSLNPVYQGGFGFDMSYYNFFLTTQFNFVADVYRFDYDLSGLQDPSNLGQFNVSTDLLRAWTEDNRITDMPSLNADNLGTDSFSDRNLKDASYIRLRNVTFGYDFPKKYLERTFIKNLKIFGQAENFYTWSKWRGWDAESNRASDQYQYPTPKIISFGLELQF